ncbi:MFS transporter [Streptomyces griseiscabiei]|uniref:MFS transporter n=1 Tax=Streptomyces griseiscabiei TaxID=2993540 RepID=A0ABU4L605_9ACTN|nr:MFS transporter [Streptomyces griseiscabiei]MBZ3905493.1 MFS transporter [Streptomyces griseiscabiei]MDX2910584.1 MFS transporter [Streptomyces griseiscabiei]
MSSTETAPDAAQADKAGFSSRHLLALAALLWTVALTPVTGLVAGNSQAEVAVHFRTTQIAWFTLGGALLGTFLTPFAMKAATMYGKKRVMVVATVAGLLGDVIAALATDYSTLIAGRVLGGAYGATAFIAYALARDIFPRHLAGTASGVLATSIGLVGLGGPFLSAWLIDHHGFRGALWFIVVSTALCLLLQLLCVPESPVRETARRMDWIGGLLLGGGLSAVVHGIGEGSAWGWTSGKTLTWIGLGALAALLFLPYESRVANPLLPLSLIKRRQVWTLFLAGSVGAGATFAVGTVTMILTLMPHIPTVSDGLGWSATKSAAVQSPISVLVITTAVAAGWLARRVDTRVLLAVGGALTTAGYAVASQLHTEIWHFVLLGLIAGPGMGLLVSVLPIMIIQSVAPEEQALANGSQLLIQSVIQVLVSQLAFTVMAQDGVVLKGTQFYLDGGYANGFLLVAGFCALGTVLVALIPKARRTDTVEAGQAA